MMHHWNGSMRALQSMHRGFLAICKWWYGLGSRIHWLAFDRDMFRQAFRFLRVGLGLIATREYLIRHRFLLWP
jgi:hypothetical protein